MEVTVALLVILATLIVGWVVRRKFWEHQILRNYGIPGPEPELIMGSYVQLKKDRLGLLTRWVKQYGKYFGYYYGGQPVIVVSDLDTVRQILTKESASFIDRPAASISVEPFKSSILYLEGEEWKRIRQALTPAFSAAKMRLMMPIMEDTVDTFVSILKSKAEAGETFDFYHVVQGLTLDVISRCALAMDADCQRNEGGLRKQVTDFFMHADSEVVNYSWGFPFLKPILTVLYLVLSTGGVIKAIMTNLAEAVRLRRTGHAPEFMDILQLMLEAQKASEGQDVSDRHVMASSFISLIAGFETTANTLAFTSQLLIDHPEVQPKILAELKTRFPDKMARGEKLSYEEIHELKYLDQVVNESLRIYPPIILFVTRACVRSCTINGYHFFAGAHVVIPVYQLHHDPELWDAPEEFRPERFAPENSASIHPAQYLPFGLGPRKCIGMRFAVLEVKMALIEMIRAVRLGAGDGFKSPPEIIVPTVMINPKGGVLVRAELLPKEELA